MMESGLLKRAAKCFSATAKPTAFATPCPNGPTVSRHKATEVIVSRVGRK
jgi:hypothetical protein